MSTPLPAWPRIHYTEGGNDPFLYYVVFGSDLDDLTLSRSKYRCDAIPGNVELMTYGPTTHPEVLDEFRHGYLWDELLRNNPALANEVSAQTKCVVIQGSVVEDSSLNYLRNTIGLLTCLLDCGGVSVFDPQSFTWWSPSDWRTMIFEPAVALPREHVVILVSNEGDTQWFHTRGMRKFGRPDLSIHRVPSQHHEAVTDLLNRFIEFQAFGGLIREGQEIRIASLPAGMYCIHGGAEEDPDFNNFHVEIKWGI